MGYCPILIGMSHVTCLIEGCPTLMKRWQHCCHKHWFRLPKDLQNEIKSASRETLPKVAAKATEFINVADAAEMESNRRVLAGR